MKSLHYIIAGFVLGILPFTAPAMAAPNTNSMTPRVGVVNFKMCAEESKIGKKERENFDNLRKQMESTLEGKEKELSELSKKFNDPDYLDGLSPEAEEEAKNRYRSLSQEMAQLQQHYYQTLNQTNLKIIQKLVDLVTAASEEVAKKLHLDLVLNEESSFFYASKLDISKSVLSMMDEMSEKMENGKE